MAEAVPGSNDLTECPVCTDQYKDPRLLSCGHHFCLVCVQKIAEDSDVIICPTCRYQTEKPVDALKRYKFNDFEAKAKLFMVQHKPREKVCSICQTTSAESTCMECKMVFCGICKEDHKILENIPVHHLQAISNFEFCEKHPEVFIVTFCKNCKVGCCFRCIRDHKGHEVSDLHSAAKEAQTHFHDALADIIPVKADVKILEEITEKRKKLESAKTELDQSIGNLRIKLKNSIGKLDNIEREASEKIQSELKVLKNTECDLQDFISTKRQLTETLNHLQGKETHVEAIFRQYDYPKYAASSCGSLVKFDSVKMPDLSDIKKCKELMSVVENTLKLNVRPALINVYKPFNTFRQVWLTSLIGKAQISGITCQPLTGNLIVRTTFCSSPIRIINPAGQIVGKVGDLSSIKSLSKRTLQGVAFDPKRKLFVLPLSDFAVVLMNEDGSLKKKILITGATSLRGVAVSPDNDCYFVSETKSNKIIMIKADDLSISDIYTTKNQSPMHIGCVKSTTGSDSISIAACCHNSHSVEIFDSSGKYIHTFEERNPSLRYPRDICVDRYGRILVCDKDNRRIIAFWMDNGRQKSKVLIEPCQLDKEEPRYVALDETGKSLYVGYEDGVIYKFIHE